MPEFPADPETPKEIVIATIGNQRNLAQVVEIVHLPDKGIFITRGIVTHFQIKDIAVPQGLMLDEIHEITGVLSYLLERIATAADLNLPFRYEPNFAVGDASYNLQESGEYMVLTRNS